MEQQIKNTWAVILGGSSGLGLASVQELASLGYHVCIVHRDRKSNLNEFETIIAQLKNTGVNIKTFNKDALKNETIDAVLSALPNNSVSVLLHSIAKGSLKPLSEMTLQDIEITSHAMAYSWWQWTTALIQQNKFSETVQNIAFTSEGSSKAWKGYGAVSIAKASLESLMRQMALEYAPLGIRSNCIQAGATLTKAFEQIPNSSQLAEAAKKRNPFKRLTTPKDVANVVGLMCSDKAQWINGTIIKADGGESNQ